eukprot:gene7353-8566_t
MPTDSAYISSNLEIGKTDTTYKRYEGRVDEIKERVISTQTIGGLLGVADLLSGKYLIVFDSAELAGNLVGHPVYRVCGARLIAFHMNQQSLITIPEYNEENAFLAMMQWVLDLEAFYFSPTTDITHSRQRATDAHGPDPRFFWNGRYTEGLSAAGIDEWVVPVTLGFMQTRTLVHAGRTLSVTLISRRSLRRAGTRYNVRGADPKGNVANAVETEQIIEDGKSYTSLVQTRGSVPLLWSQLPDLKYKPRVVLRGSDAANASIVSRHFTELRTIYGTVTAVNLIDRKGDELRLGEAYARHAAAVAKDARPTYIWFDFHAKCKNMKYGALSELTEAVIPDQSAHGFLHVRDGKVVSKQSGIVRVNCIDNLDRTNVVQNLFAKESLKTQLDTLNLPRTILDSSDFDYLFKNIWADHGDRISTQYSGTGALKNDFTRTGKRNMQGVLRDGENSVKRYYLNNFVDGFRQILWIVLALVLALFMFYVLPSFSSNPLAKLILALGYWVAVFYGLTTVMKQYNRILLRVCDQGGKIQVDLMEQLNNNELKSVISLPLLQDSVKPTLCAQVQYMAAKLDIVSGRRSGDFTWTIFILIIGCLIPCAWLGAFSFIRSSEKRVRRMAISTIVIFFMWLVWTITVVTLMIYWLQENFHGFGR